MMQHCFLRVAVVIAACTATGESDDLCFEKTCLDTTFRSEGVGVGDVNRDGAPDILAGEVWYEAPSWTRHEMQTPGDYQATAGYSQTFSQFSLDVNGDGWTDSVITTMMGEPCWWFENPKGAEGHWKKHMGTPSACNESPQFVDLLGNGKPVLVCGVQPEGFMAWFERPENGRGAWTRHVISGPKAPGTRRYSHGLGTGDINGDGRLDILVTAGWWEAPEDRRTPNWTFHPADLGDACADMAVTDLDGDGDNDVFSSSAHDYGVWWYEQQPGEDHPVFVKHTIDQSISQTHALCMADLDGDGRPEFVTGKRWMAHNGRDPGSGEDVLLVYYKVHQEPDGVRFSRHLIAEGVGVGTQFRVEDLNGNGAPDIAVSNKRGVHVLVQ